MNLKDIYNLMDRFEGSNIDSMELEMEQVKLKLNKNEPVSYYTKEETPKVAKQEIANIDIPKETENKDTIKAPLVGTFYSAANPDSEDFVKKGTKVNKGDTVCVIEAMKMINEVVASCDCIIEDVLVNNEDMVAYNDDLFVIKKL